MRVSLFPLGFICFIFLLPWSLGCQHFKEEKEGVLKEASIRKEGRYLGFLVHNEEKWPFELDLLASEANAGPNKAILRVFSGVGREAELASWYFPAKEEGSSQVGAADTFLSVVDDKQMILQSSDSFEARGKVLVGSYAMDLHGVLVGDQAFSGFSMLTKTLFPKVAIASDIFKIFEGNCGGYETKFQFRPDASVRPSGFFRHAVAGLTGVSVGEEPSLCPSGSASCTKGLFHSGEYHFLSGSLDLKGRPSSLSCHLQKGKLECDGCSLSAKKEEGSFLSLRPTLASDPLKRDYRPLAPLGQGEYFGYLYHRYTGKFQPMRLLLRKEEAASSENMVLHGVANLFFGSFDSPEYIVFPIGSHKFLKAAKTKIIETKGELVLRVSYTPEGLLFGEVYGKSRGLIGSMLLGRNGLPSDFGVRIHEGNTLSLLSKSYPFSQFSMELEVRSGTSDEKGEVYPLEARGRLFYRQPASSFKVESVYYDFYRGRLYVRGENARVVYGELLSPQLASLVRLDPDILFAPKAPVGLSHPKERPAFSAGLEDIMLKMEQPETL